jgi:hypothetical protein
MAQLMTMCTDAHTSACEVYLTGVFDVLAAGARDHLGQRIICPADHPTVAQSGAWLREYFVTQSVQYHNKYDQEPAVKMVMSAFRTMMPCH